MYEYKATVVRVVDGDTAHLKVDVGLDIYHQLTLRFFGINAPETSTPEGKAAQAFLREFLPVGQQVILQTVKDSREKYGRYLGVLFKDGVNVNEVMLAAGHAQLKVY